MPLIEEITESDPAPSHGQSNTSSVKIEVVDNPPKQTQKGKYGVNAHSKALLNRQYELSGNWNRFFYVYFPLAPAC